MRRAFSLSIRSEATPASFAAPPSLFAKRSLSSSAAIPSNTRLIRVPRASPESTNSHGSMTTTTTSSRRRSSSSIKFSAVLLPPPHGEFRPTVSVSNRASTATLPTATATACKPVRSCVAGLSSNKYDDSVTAPPLPVRNGIPSTASGRDAKCLPTTRGICHFGAEPTPTVGIAQSCPHPCGDAGELAGEMSTAADLECSPTCPARDAKPGLPPDSIDRELGARTDSVIALDHAGLPQLLPARTLCSRSAAPQRPSDDRHECAR